jgi:multiple sugar transport system substrate-binding protein
MKLVKKLVSLLLAACMVFAVAGCGDKEETGGNKISKEGRDITLRFADWFDRDLQQHLADAFMEANPNIYVELIEIDQNSWGSGLQNLASTGDLPDAFCTFDLATATANGWTADITEYYDADPTTAKISDGLKVAGVYNGKRYGLVTEQYPCVVLVNKTLFDANGVELPGYDWTIDQMYNLATKLTKVNDNQFGLSDNVLSYLRDVRNLSLNASSTTSTRTYFVPEYGYFYFGKLNLLF